MGEGTDGCTANGSSEGYRQATNVTPPSGSTKEHQIELTNLSYSPVSSSRKDGVKGDFWAETFEASELEDVVVTRFQNYVLRAVVNKSDEFYEVDFDNDHGRKLQKRLDQVLKLKKDAQQRKETVQLLADDLSKLMEKVSNPQPGAIFVVEALVNGKRTATLVKLDLEQREVVALQEERRHALKREFFERALSEDAKKMRKALTYPSPGEGDARTVQYDTESDYWRTFAGAKPLREAKRAANGLIEAAKNLAREVQKTVDEKQMVSLMDQMQDTKQLTPEKAADVLKDVLNLPQKPVKIAERVQKELKEATLAEVAPLKAVRFAFRGNMSITVPVELIRAKIVTVSEEKGDVVIRIKDSSVDRFEQIG